LPHEIPDDSRRHTLLGRPAANESAGNVIDFYGSCDHDPLGTDEIKAQRRVLRRGIYEDGE
jgi:hypothetical protein